MEKASLEHGLLPAPLVAAHWLAAADVSRVHPQQQLPLTCPRFEAMQE
jgi:hypothetical protein